MRPPPPIPAGVADLRLPGGAAKARPPTPPRPLPGVRRPPQWAAPLLRDVAGRGGASCLRPQRRWATPARATPRTRGGARQSTASHQENE